jgi:hypothetical protein
MEPAEMHEAANDCRAAAARTQDEAKRRHLIEQALHLDSYANAIELERLRRMLPQ